ncbi:N5-carboxyaminoimidazole ribonucleotide mutase [bioreactor metagenome]|uniref:N5-carboxyaminoimidazole ribonucleotide mutase n=1 Tax=bioreactor metagenome TaxID=1076179 RepID=A0A645HNK8_9ZZZZ
MGSASDAPLAKEALRTLARFGVPYAARVLSAHRSPDEAAAFAREAAAEGCGVIIAFAGKAAHLAGVLAAHTILPVIGVPVSAKDLGGLDALLSTVQMPGGVPVASVSIDGAVNAALLAVRILALGDDTLAEQLKKHARALAEKTAEADAALQKEIEAL